jgi:hypothetical protein
VHPALLQRLQGLSSDLVRFGCSDLLTADRLEKVSFEIHSFLFSEEYNGTIHKTEKVVNQKKYLKNVFRV